MTRLPELRRMLVAGTVFAAGSATHAADYIWTGAVSDNWSSSANWVPSGVPGAGDQAIFPPDANRFDVHVDGTQAASKIFFVAGQGYRLYGDTLRLGSGDVEMIGTEVETHTVDCRLDLLGDAFWDLRNSNLIINGEIWGDPFEVGLVKTGAGTLTLNDSNFFFGGLDCREGTLELGDYRAVSSTDVTLAAGTRLLADSAEIGGLNGSGEVAVTGQLVLNPYVAATYSGDLSGDFSLYKGGRGKQTLDGDLAGFNGQISTSRGALRLLSDLGVNNTNTFDIYGKLLSASYVPAMELRIVGDVHPGQDFGAVGTLTTPSLTASYNNDFDFPTITIDIGGTQAGVDHDQILVDGPIHLEHARIKVNYINGYVASPGDTFTILNGTSITGRFNAFDYPDNQPWYVAYDEAAGTATLKFCDGGEDCDGNGLGDQCEFDSDGDGVIDACDLCPGFDDNGPDADNDGVADDCDVCLGNDFSGDRDEDGVCDDIDVCNGGDDNGPDADGDGVPDACDACDAGQFDADGDDDVDFDDLVGFEDCLQGPGIATSVGCDCYDYNNDLQLTMNDFAEFQNTFSDQFIVEGPGEISLFNIKGGFSDKGFALFGENEQDLSAWSVGLIGDLNDDGLSELLVGAPSWGEGDDEQAGRAYVIWGGTDLSNVNLADIAAGNGGYAIDGWWGGYGHPFTEREIGSRSSFPGAGGNDGGPQGEGFGFQVGPAGDVNGDGVEDMLVSAPYAPAHNQIWGGRTYVLYGGRQDGASSPYSLEQIMFNDDGMIIMGERGICPTCPEKAGHLSGLAAFGGEDFNGDGLSDVFIGAPEYETAGRGYVVFGKLDWSPVDLAALNKKGLVLDVEPSILKYGNWAHSPGDLDGDGLAEAWLGSGFSISYLVHGREQGGIETTLSLTGSDPNSVSRIVPGDWNCNGSDCEGRWAFGNPIGGGGDFNGDGRNDYVTSTEVFETELYEVLIVFGSPEPGQLANGDSVFGTTTAPIDPPLGGVRILSNNFRAITPETQLELANDINGDGYDDLVFSGNGADGIRTYVIFGGPDSRTIDLDNLEMGVDGLVMFDGNGRAHPGMSISTQGDLNGDGLYDIAIGAPRDDEGASNTGTAYVIHGSDFTGAITHRGDDSFNTLTGSPNNDTMVGGLGPDTLRGFGGQDVLYGGAGDDVLAVGDNNFRRVDGGAGYDTLIMAGAGSLDTRSLRGRIRNIEKVDMRNGGGDIFFVQKIDLLNMSSTTNTLWVEANEDDLVISEGDDWVDTGNVFPSVRRFQSGHAQLWVSNDAQLRLSPVIDASNIEVDEDAQEGTLVAQVQVTDPDGDGINEVTIVGGSGLGLFSIDPFSGDLFTSVPLDYETTTSYTLEFQAIDGEGSRSTKTIRVEVLPVNEAPTLVGDPITATIAEHEPSETVLGSFSGTDVDAGDVVGFELDFADPNLASPAPSASFAIDPNGVLTVADAGRLDYETASTVDFFVYAKDAGGLRSRNRSRVTINLTDVSSWTFPIRRTFATNNASMWGTDSATGPDPLGFEKRINLNGSPVESLSLPGVDFTVGASGAIDVEGTWTMDRGTVNVSVPIASSLTMPDEVTLGEPFQLGLVFTNDNGLPSMTGTSPAADFDLLIDFDDFRVNTPVRNFGPYDSSNSSDTYLTSSTPSVWQAELNSFSRMSLNGLDTELLAATEIDWDEYILQFLSLAGLPSNEGSGGPYSYGGANWFIEYVLWDITLAGTVNVRQDLAFEIHGYDTVLVLEDGSQIGVAANQDNTVTLPVGADSNGDGYVEFQLRMDLDQTFSNYSDFYGTVSKRFRVAEVDVAGQVIGCDLPACVAGDTLGPVIDTTLTVDIARGDAGVPTPWPTGETGTFPLGGFNTVIMTGSFDLSNN